MGLGHEYTQHRGYSEPQARPGTARPSENASQDGCVEQMREAMAWTYYHFAGLVFEN
jgi:hypothetical protein